MILLYVTCKDKNEAKKIASFLLKKKLIACANFFPINSLYVWKDKLVNGKEFVLLLKTTNKNKNKIIKQIEKLHSYECPCIISLNVKANKKFDEWVKSQVN